MPSEVKSTDGAAREMKKYIVRLSDAERKQLNEIIRKGKAAAYKIRHAHILLKADADGPAWTDEAIAQSFCVQVSTVQALRQRLVEQGLEAALNRKKQNRPSRLPLLDGEAEAKLIALRCGETPEGHARWTLRLLADKAVELEIVESISYETVRQALKKTKCVLT
jgi:transposase